MSSIRNQAIAAAFMKLVEETVVRENKEFRAGTQTVLDDNLIRTLDVALPDGTEVATISASTPKPAPTVTDEQALLAWALEHAPAEVTTRTVHEIRPAFLTALLDQMAKRKTAEWVNDDGEPIPVPGVEFTTSRSRSHTVKLAPGAAEALTAAFRRGEIDLGGRLRMLTTGTDQ